VLFYFDFTNEAKLNFNILNVLKGGEP